MIEKNAFFYWGNDTLSWLRYLSFYTFRKYNPEWKVYLYRSNYHTSKNVPWRTCEIQDYHNFNGKDYTDKLKDLDIEIIEWKMDSPYKHLPGLTSCTESDFFRWSILSNNSGYYFDNDILFIKSLEDFHNIHKNSDIVLCYNSHFSLGCLGSSGNDIFLYKDLLQHSLNNFDRNNYQTAGPMAIITYSSMFFTNEQDLLEKLKKKYNGYKFSNHPMVNFYPFQWNETHKIFKETHNVPNDTYGIHWFAGSQISQEYNNMLNEDTYKNYKSTITEFIERVLNE